VDVPSGGDQIVARFDAATKAKEGQAIKVWLDATKVHVFEPESGANLTRRVKQPTG
jgi:multiple sugar transport system ATP-binding protein